MDLKLARHNMVQQQIRPLDVSDPGILAVLENLPREAFVLAPHKKLAYSDTALPIGHGQVILPPNLVGRILQCLQLGKKETVLEIGTGTGYLTACLAKLVKKVVSIEIFPDLSQLAAKNLAALNIQNVQCEVGNGLLGFPDCSPFHAIIVTGAMLSLPTTLREQLAVSGRLFAILGTEPVMTAVLSTELGQTKWHEHPLFETIVPPLLNSLPTAEF